MKNNIYGPFYILSKIINLLHGGGHNLATLIEFKLTTLAH
jgi:hypothetical protein